MCNSPFATYFRGEFNLTQDGQSYYQRCVELLADFDELQQLFQQQAEQLKGVLRIDMPTALTRELVIPALPLLLTQHPHLHIQLSSTDRRVDLVAEGFDAVVRIGQLSRKLKVFIDWLQGLVDTDYN